MAAELGWCLVLCCATYLAQTWRAATTTGCHLVSNDPDFELKAADVISQYLSPPANAAVFCVHEKTAIQALDRKDRMLPLARGRAESHGFEYNRNSMQPVCCAEHTRWRGAWHGSSAIMSSL